VTLNLKGGKTEIVKNALEAVRNLEEYVSPEALKAIRKVKNALKISIPARHRMLFVISGKDPIKVGSITAKMLLEYENVYKKVAEKKPLELLYAFHDEFEDAKLRKEIVKRTIKEKASLLHQTTTRYEESEKFLGTTFQALVLDLTNDVKPNDVGRLTGVVEGGGLIVVQAPSWDSWDTAMTIFKQKLLIEGFKEPRHIFIRWFKRKLLEHKNIFVYDSDKEKLIYESVLRVSARPKEKIIIPEKTLFPQEIYTLALTNDQVKVINVLEWLYEKPPKNKKKVIVVTADRGRGKSCAVGIGLIGLASELRKVKHRVRILVTAPSLTNVQSLMELALRAAERLNLSPKPIRRGDNIIEIQGNGFSLEYWEPATIPKLQGDIVAVDEASGIHVPLLHKIWRAHRRIVFAATIHGYEGAGRGFNIRFLKRIKDDPNTLLKHIDMDEPIRYARDDPIEKWLFDVLLLDAEPAELDEKDLEDIKNLNLEYVKLDPEWLFSKEGEKALRELFGIYVIAHYRNEPDDLGMLADAPHHSIRAVRTSQGKIVAAAQVAEEGGLSDETIDRLLRGEKTPGNIIPDRILKHLRIKEFGKMKGWRIVRIATHPEVQNRGIGSKLLEYLYQESIERGYDWLGSGFGVNEQLLRFWLKNGFKALHLSPDRNPVSGEYTTLVLKPISSEAKKIVEIAVKEFKLKLINSLYDTYKDLETEVAIMLLNQEPRKVLDIKRPYFDKIQIDRLWVYCWGPMTYEAATDIINILARTYWLQDPQLRPKLTKEEEWILVSKVLQGKSWESVADELGWYPYRVMAKLKDAIRKMARHYFGIDETSEVGVRLSEIIEENV
jgi:tRNA(Met) cytidine acetyltransferase